jgi:hypothetical protein
MKSHKDTGKRINIIFLILAVFMVLASSLVQGLGVSPAKKTLDFQPGTNVEVVFNIINSEQATFDASFSAIGELADAVFFEKPTIHVNATDSSVSFKVIMYFPQKLEPGIRSAIIKITPSIPDSGSMFTVFIAPQIPVYVRVPYPTKYADISFVVLEVDEGTPVPIYVEFDNLGSEDIQSAGAQVEIRSPSGSLLKNLSTPQVSVSKNSLGKAQALPSPIMRKGLYNAAVRANYDGVSKSFEASFRVGAPLVRIQDFLTKKLTVDTINKVIFKAYNEWNTELSVSGFLAIGEKQTEMPVFKLQPGESREVTGFFDTTGIMPGQYDMSIMMAYADQLKTESFRVEVVEKPIIPAEQLPMLEMLITFGLIVLIIIALIILLRIKRKRRQRERNL